MFLGLVYTLGPDEGAAICVRAVHFLVARRIYLLGAGGPMLSRVRVYEVLDNFEHDRGTARWGKPRVASDGHVDM